MSKTTSNRVCVGMYGFIRDCIPKYIDITNFLMMLDPTQDTIFDVFIVCPYLKFETDEFVEEKKDSSYIQSDEIVSCFINDESIQVNIRTFFYDYNSEYFITKSRKLGFPDKTSLNKFPYRIFSMFESISILCDCILQNSDIDYKYFILSRLDKIPLIYNVSFDTSLTLLDNEFIGLKSSSFDEIQRCCMLTGKDGLKTLVYLIEYTGYSEIKDDKFISAEYLMFYYLMNQTHYQLDVKTQDYIQLKESHLGYCNNIEYFDSVISKFNI